MMESQSTSIYTRDGKDDMSMDWDSWRRLQSDRPPMESGSASDDGDMDWSGEMDLTALIWMGVITIWIFVAVRVFTTVVLFKFAKEGNLIKAGGNGMDLTDSHPCRQKS